VNVLKVLNVVKVLVLFMKVILFQPQIPQNTGNIVRTCSVTGSSLALVRPLGFSVTDRWLKRAGLDYWEGVDVSFIDDLEHLLDHVPQNFYFFSSKAKQKYSEIAYESNDLLIFGSETTGLPPLFAEKWPDKFATIPMIPEARCLNLATSVGIVLYEAWRQLHFN
jgi:tRNA (cytidine/uridine-2'-O-)-methyltransferase